MKEIKLLLLVGNHIVCSFWFSTDNDKLLELIRVFMNLLEIKINVRMCFPYNNNK
jgi:hypothetical protein